MADNLLTAIVKGKLSKNNRAKVADNNNLIELPGCQMINKIKPVRKTMLL